MGKAYLSLDSFSNTLQNQHAAYFYFHPDTVRTHVAQWLSSQTVLAYSFFFMAMLLQLSFALGLLTKKWDKYLLVSLLLFHVMDWFLMNLGIFMGMCVMSYLFLLPKSISSDLKS